MAPTLKDITSGVVHLPGGGPSWISDSLHCCVFKLPLTQVPPKISTHEGSGLPGSDAVLLRSLEEVGPGKAAASCARECIDSGEE